MCTFRVSVYSNNTKNISYARMLRMALKGHSHEKFMRISLYIIDLVQTKVCQHFLNFQNHLSKSYDFLCRMALDVKWVNLIYKNAQLHARKICIRAAVVCCVGVLLMHGQRKCVRLCL
jgi:hypothetical protein